MELVDANTKNFVFLTLSQFNDTQNLQRTRVSMRRDQPFWQGGNSYICCESFRVTSSPNPGGLYYKIFGPEWYMGCSLKKDSPIMPNAAAFSELVVPAGDTTYPYAWGKYCSAINVIASDGGPCEGSFILRGLAVNGALEDVHTNDPRVCQTYLSRFVNQYHLTKGAWCRLSTNPGAAAGNAWTDGQLLNSPATEMNGNGIGPDKMFYPELRVYPASIPTLVTKLREMAAAHSHTTAQFQFIMQQQPQPDGGGGFEFGSELLGTGLHIQQRTARTANTKAWNPDVYGSFFRVMGLQDVEYNFQVRFFQGANEPVNAVGHCQGCPLRQMKYTELKVGAACWVDIPTDDPNYNTPGRFFGTITKIPAFQNDLYPVWAMTNATVEGVIAPLSILHATELCACQFMFTSDGTRVSRSIKAPFRFIDTQNHNLNPDAWDRLELCQVGYYNHSSDSERLCIRRPGAEEDRYIYTPNEMFYSFNKDEPGFGKLPYLLQTDENGGFVVHWNNTQSTPGTNFIISVGLSEELGLNPFFEHEVESYTNNESRDLFYVLRQGDEWEQDQPINLWMDRRLLSDTDPATTWTPAQPHPMGNFHTGSAITQWDAEGNKYYYVDRHIYARDVWKTRTVRIYPRLATDVDGVEFYEYDDLPVEGHIGNSQMVSVESFSTYSEITLVIPNLPFQSMLGTSSDERILASLRLPFIYGTGNKIAGDVSSTSFSYYGDLIFNTLSSRSYLKITTDQQLYDCDVEVRLIRRDGEMDVMQLPYRGEFQVKLRLLQTQ